MSSFSYLSQSAITEIKNAFNDAKMTYDAGLRDLLLIGINHQYVQSLAKYNSDKKQLTSDLSSLNGVERLTDASVPLREWLTNASEQFAVLVQVEVFDRALAEVNKAQTASGPQQPTDTNAIVEGLEALSKLIRKSQSAYEAFVIYGNVFQTALDDFDVIADYKLLHEELHSLQLAWPDDVAPALRTLEENPKAKMELRKDSTNLKNIVGRQRTIFLKGSVDRDETKWLDNFDQLQKELDQALSDMDKVKIETKFDTIRSQATVHLDALNTRLKRAIEQLKLENLVNTMKTLCQALKGIAGERFSRHIQQYEEGIAQLGVLDREITKLITQHTDWQGAISRLQMLNEQLEGASKLEDPQTASVFKAGLLAITLETIEKKIEPLHQDWTRGWAADMTISVAEFRTAVGEGRLDKAESWFFTYRDQALQFFFDLDSDMKKRSEELRKIGEKLRMVNKELD